MNPINFVYSQNYMEEREKQWDFLFNKLSEVQDHDAASFSLNSVEFTSTSSDETSDSLFVFSGDEDPKCFYYKINDDPATAKPLQFNHTLQDCYKINHCYLMKEFVDMMLSISRNDNARIQIMLDSYVKKAHVQPAIDQLEYYCSKLYFILFYDIWLKKTHNNETVQRNHGKFTSKLLGELKDEVHNQKHFIDYFKHVHFAFTITERIVQKSKKMHKKKGKKNRRSKCNQQ
ncbi:PREDICTED: uncharacterized protein LOC108567703 [Nicrophorus vespilloides]|uniref:Uncharacterized protein LOC108567703 n=1 Tax=Nicrophorus vespilloides TaxID=110193 RepID=A0ABM1NAF7_NICVS|nr:PREDICTED: uncharacterized protein LOC108567703 [Nicrophorus vespilloides]